MRKKKSVALGLNTVMLQYYTSQRMNPTFQLSKIRTTFSLTLLLPKDLRFRIFTDLSRTGTFSLAQSGRNGAGEAEENAAKTEEMHSGTARDKGHSKKHQID